MKSTVTRERKEGTCVAYIYVHALAKDVFLCENDRSTQAAASATT